jgi:hypothetical protein
MDPLTDTHVPPVRAGSPASQVTALYQGYATGLVRLAMLMLADQQAAEDVVQEAFLGLYRRGLPGLNPDNSVGLTWTGDGHTLAFASPRMTSQITSGRSTSPARAPTCWRTAGRFSRYRTVSPTAFP